MPLKLHTIFLVATLSSMTFWPSLTNGQRGKAPSNPAVASPAASPAVAAPIPPATSATSPVEAPSVSMVVTGGSHGLASRSSTGDTILLLYEELSARGGATRITGSYSALHDDYKRMLAANTEKDIDAALALLKDGDQEERRIIAENVSALESDRAIVIQYPPAPHLDLLKLMELRNAKTHFAPRLRRISLRLVEMRVGERRARFFERHEAGKIPLRRDPLTWDTALLLRGEGRLGENRAQFSMLMKSYAEGARRARLVSELAAKFDGSLLVSAGNEVGTREPETGKRSSTRELDFDTLSKLAYDAYLPGFRELYFGPKRLKETLARHPLPLVATNLVFRAGEKKGKPVFARYRLKRVGKLRVAFLGLMDPGLRNKIHSPQLVCDLEVTDPLIATTRAISELEALPEGRPDLIVVLSNLDHRDRGKFIAGAIGVDLYLGDSHGGGRYRPDLSLNLKKRHRRMRNARGVAYITQLNYLLVGEITVTFEPQPEGFRLTNLFAKHIFIDSTLPQDMAIHRKLMKVTLDDLKRHRGEILPPVEKIIGDDPQLLKRLHNDPNIARWLPKEKTDKHKWQLWMTTDLWGALISNLLLDATKAEVAITPKPRRMSSTMPGPIRERLVRQWLDKDEPVLLYELSGKRLRKLLHALSTTRGSFALTGVDDERKRVGGRRISQKETYEVALTHSVRDDESIAPILKGLTPGSRFRRLEEGALLTPSSEGKPVRLRELVVARLKWIRKEEGGITEGYLGRLRRALSPQGQELRPRWTLSAENVSFSFAGYSNLPAAAWTRNPGTRETRAVTPGNYALGARGNVALTYDSASFAWENALRFKFSRVVIDLSGIPGQEDVTNEPAGQDDVVASSELRLKFIEVALDHKRHVKIVPYTQLAFDSEFTATIDQLTGAAFPHQKQLRAAAGLVSHPGSVLREVRLGGLFKNDFDRDQGQPEGGLMAGAKLAIPLWGATLDLSGEVQYYFPTDVDTVEDLGLIFEGLARLRVPFTRTLSLSLFADLFLYEHKVNRVTDILGSLKERGLGMSLILGAGLSFDHVAKL
ncbi:MAG: hypothetical protein JRH20_16920 [Deltaproteobacteria bacterium]|nr:hypothetical protein [Deltaproteobacteria bacterium]